MIAEMIMPGDPRWMGLLDRVEHDFYHRPEYTALCALHSGGQGRAFYATCDESVLLIPLILQPLPRCLGAPDTWLDGSSPYGYASPLMLRGQHCDHTAELWTTFLEYCRESTILSVFLRLNPLLETPVDCSHVGNLVREGETVVVDLHLADDDAWRQMRNNHRRDIRKLEQKGFHVVIDDWDAYDHFISLYLETMKRNQASRNYFFRRSYFADLADLPGGVHLCTVRAADAAVAAAGLFFKQGDLVQYHLSGTDEAYLSDSPLKLLLHGVRTWARGQGARSFHLGGGVGCRDDSLMRFKAGFSPFRRTFYSLRVIADANCYQALSRDSRAQSQPSMTKHGYFPEYRQVHETMIQ